MALAKMLEATMHTPSFWLIAILLIGGLLMHFYSVLHLARLRASGFYPPVGKARMADVIRLKNAGHPAFAMRCYREIHACSLREAKDALGKLTQDAS